MKKFILLAMVVVSLASCRKDIDLTADYKEITIIYGLLDPSDSIQYIRISKAFLGDGNAYEMAAIPDSSEYGDEMQVTVEKYDGGVYKKTYYLKDTVLYSPTSGLFPQGKKLYYFETPLGTNDGLYQYSEYRIVAKNTKTGNEAYAKIKMVYDFSGNKPFFLNNPTYSVNLAKLDESTPDPNDWIFNTLVTEWDEAVNARSYVFAAKFYYHEEDTATHTIVDKYVDWSLGSYKGSDLSGKGTINSEISGESFFSLLASKLEVNSGLIRHAGKSTNSDYQFDFIITAGGDEITTYMETNDPSTGILIEKPDYTNIVNGYGVFSCRYNKIIKGRTLDLKSQDYLKTGSLAMQNLNFQ